MEKTYFNAAKFSMKKIVLFFAVLSVTVGTVLAQQPKVSLSQPFEEPEDGWNKVMQLSNGNTFFLHFTKKEGIEVTVYDPAHKVISQKQLTSQLWNPRAMRQSIVEGLYEIQGQPVLFIQQLQDRTPTLFRLRLDAQTGEIEKEKQIGSMERYKSGSAWAMAYGGVDASDVFVEKDPASDAYAVAYFNGFAKESGKRIEVVHYSGNHKILNRSYYFDSTAESPFKYVKFIGMTVLGEKQVSVCTYGFNTEKSGGKDSRVIVSKLAKNENTFRHNMLDFSDDFRDTKAIMRFNPGTNMIQLLTLTLMQTKSKFFSNKNSSYYLTLLSFIDPENLTVAFTKPMVSEKVSTYAMSNFGLKDGYSGMPQNMIINEDKTTTLLMEEMTTQTTTQNGRMVRQQTFLGGIGISELSDRGTEESGYVLPKLQAASGVIPPLYISHKSQGFWSYGGGNGMMGMANNNAFMSYDYVDAGKDRYILYNDYPSNLRRENSAKRKTVAAISDANTVCFKIKDGHTDQFLPFGTPTDDRVSNFSYIESSDFLPATKTYATLMVHRDGRKKEAHIAWITF
jgi:hypothetical protein